MKSITLAVEETALDRVGVNAARRKTTIDRIPDLQQTYGSVRILNPFRPI